MGPSGGSPHQRGLRLDAIDPRQLRGTGECDEGARPPRQRGKTELGAQAIEQTGDGRGDSAASTPNGRGQPVNLAEVGWAEAGFFDEDEQEGVGHDVENVADEEGREDAVIEPGCGEEQEIRDDEVGERVADCDDDEKAPHTEPGCQ